MKIAAAHLQLASSHVSETRHEIRESLKMWSGQRRPNFAGEARRPPATADAVSLSEAGKAASGRSDATPASGSKLDLLRLIIEYMTGRKVDTIDAADLQAEQSSAGPAAPAAAGYGIEYDRQETLSEVEQTQFSASGRVATSDGRQIDFDVHLAMSRSYQESSSVSLRLGDAARTTDPLVLNFAGTAAQLTDQRFSFDLNGDGQQEQLHQLAAGSGFLALDRNSDGRINDGKELFGPRRNNGFSELAELDNDHNGWIDENDAAFGQLLVWSPAEENPDSLQSIAEAGVGAISLSHVATPFSLKGDANELFGEIRNSGIFLQENGEAGTIQHVDLTA